MNDKERMVLTGIIGAQLGPLLDRWLVPPADQTIVIGWIIVSIPIVYHVVAGFVEKYGPRIMDRWFPPVPALPMPIPTLGPPVAPSPLFAPTPAAPK